MGKLTVRFENLPGMTAIIEDISPKEAANLIISFYNMKFPKKDKSAENKNVDSKEIHCYNSITEQIVEYIRTLSNNYQHSSRDIQMHFFGHVLRSLKDANIYNRFTNQLSSARKKIAREESGIWKYNTVYQKAAQGYPFKLFKFYKSQGGN